MIYPKERHYFDIAPKDIERGNKVGQDHVLRQLDLISFIDE